MTKPVTNPGPDAVVWPLVRPPGSGLPASMLRPAAEPEPGTPASPATEHDQHQPEHRRDAPAGPADSPPGGRRLVLTPASRVRMRPVRWFWTDRIPAGGLTVVPGREGIGKSLTLAWLTAQVTRGMLPGCYEGVPRAVIYAASEDSWSHTIGPRLLAAGADLDLVFRVDVEHDGQVDALTLPTDCDALAAEITRLGVGLLAADPLLSLIHAGIDTHRDRDLRTALEPLSRLADTTGCAVVGLAHFNKSASPDALNLITGSRAFSAVARAVIAIARDTDTEDGSCVMSQAKNNLGRLDLPSLRYVIDSAEIPTPEGPAYVGVLRFTGETDRSVSDILADNSSDPEQRAERDQAADWLTDYLTEHDGSAPRAEVIQAAKAAGITKRTLERARTRAAVKSVPAGFQKGTLWQLTGNDPESPTAPTAPQVRQPRQLPSPGAHGADGHQMARMPTDPNAQSPAAPPEIGPCARCRKPTRRYGHNANPLCPDCQPVA